MPELSIQYIILFSAFVLPGAISLSVLSQKIPQAVFSLKDKIIEAVSFSVFNFIFLYGGIHFLLEPGFISQNPIKTWFIIVVCFIVFPGFWPFLYVWVARNASSRGWILVQAKTGFDDFFSRATSGCWLQVELLNGEIVGGRFGEKSYASAFPNAGHLFVEELWTVENGKFTARVDGCPGIILRPEEYRNLKVFEWKGLENEQ